MRVASTDKGTDVFGLLQGLAPWLQYERTSMPDMDPEQEQGLIHQ